VNARGELLAGNLVAAARIKQSEDQLRRTTRDIHFQELQSTLGLTVGFSDICCEL
jgi:hypothetical protein